MTTLRFGILTVSDRSFAGLRADDSGPALENIILRNGWSLQEYRVAPDERMVIEEVLKKWADSGLFDVILTTGGTGLAQRDITPEATLAVVDRVAPGLQEAMRAASLQLTPHAMLSRGVAGARGRCLIVNLPGSPKAAVDNLNVILTVLPHAVQLLTNDPGAETGH